MSTNGNVAKTGKEEEEDIIKEVVRYKCVCVCVHAYIFQECVCGCINVLIYVRHYYYCHLILFIDNTVKGKILVFAVFSVLIMAWHLVVSARRAFPVSD